MKSFKFQLLQLLSLHTDGDLFKLLTFLLHFFHIDIYIYINNINVLLFRYFAGIFVYLFFHRRLKWRIL